MRRARVARARLVGALLASLSAVSVAPSAVAAAQMPDVRMMSGMPRPVDDLPNGAVVVRVIRDELTNYLPNQRVQLGGAGKVDTVTTNAEGQAEFRGLAPGSVVVASVVVDGETIQSRPFEVPAQGGVRMLLVASSTGAKGPAAGDAGVATAPVPGVVNFGGDSRIIVQFADDELEIFYLLDAVNAAMAPVASEPLVITLPEVATNASVLEGSSPQVTVAGRKVTITGPFPPGRTSFQVAFNVPVPGAEFRYSQVFPATLERVSLFVQKVDGVALATHQAGDVREMPAESRTFISAAGPAVKAGEPLVFELTGLPHRSNWPRNLALALALVIFGAGAYAAFGTGGRTGAGAERARLEARREQVYRQMLAIDQRERAGQVPLAAATTERATLVAELERIYGALDTTS